MTHTAPRVQTATQTAGSPRLAMFAALQVRDFRFLWLGTAAGHVGFWAYIIAQGWLAWELTGSATYLGVVNAVNGVLGLVLMLPSGVLADRWNRRILLIYTNAGMLLAAVLITVLLAGDRLDATSLLGVVVLMSVAGTLNLPARQSLGPQLVGPRLLANAVAVNSVSFNTSRVIGPAIAGLLIATVGLVGCFVFVTVCMLLATIVTVMISAEPARDLAHARGRSVVQNFADALRYVRDEPVVRGCVIVAALQNLFGMTYAQLMPMFASDVLEVGGGGMGGLMAAVGIGSMMGAFASAALSELRAKGMAVFSTGIAFGAAVLVFSVVPSVPLAMAALIVVGLASAISMIINQTILNLATPDMMRGRAMSVYMMTWSLSPLSALPAGWAADHVGAPITVAFSGVFIMLAMAWAGLGLARVRRFRDEHYLAGFPAASR